MVEAVLNELGERPTQNMSVIILRASEPTYARVHVPQPLRTRIRAGDSAEVHIDGYDAPFVARVRWISSEAAFTPYFALTQYDRSRLSYAAEIDLLSPDAHRIPAGIPVEVYFVRRDFPSTSLNFT